MKIKGVALSIIKTSVKGVGKNIILERLGKGKI